MNVQNQVVFTDPEDGIMYLVTYDDKGSIIRKQEVTVVPPKTKKRKSKFKQGGFYTVDFKYNEFIQEKYQQYSKVTFGVLNALLLRLEFNNRIETFRQKELAEKLKTGQASISRALKELVEDKVIYKPEGKYNYYFSDDFIAYVNVEERKK